jgi:hypothetical protein
MAQALAGGVERQHRQLGGAAQPAAGAQRAATLRRQHAEVAGLDAEGEVALDRAERAVEQGAHATRDHVDLAELPGVAAELEIARAARRGAAQRATQVADVDVERAAAETLAARGEVEVELAGQVRPDARGVQAADAAAEAPALVRRPRRLATAERDAVEQLQFGGRDDHAVLGESPAHLQRHGRQGERHRLHRSLELEVVGPHFAELEAAGRAAHHGRCARERPAEILPATFELESRAVLDDADLAGGLDLRARARVHQHDAARGQHLLREAAVEADVERADAEPGGLEHAARAVALLVDPEREVAGDLAEHRAGAEGLQVEVEDVRLAVEVPVAERVEYAALEARAERRAQAAVDAERLEVAVDVGVHDPARQPLRGPRDARAALDLQRVGRGQQADRVEAQVVQLGAAAVDADGAAADRARGRDVGEVEHRAIDRDQLDQARLGRRDLDREERGQEARRALGRRRLARVHHDLHRIHPGALRLQALPKQRQYLDAALDAVDAQRDELVLELEVAQLQAVGDRARGTLGLHRDLADALGQARHHELQPGLGVREENTAGPPAAPRAAAPGSRRRASACGPRRAAQSFGEKLRCRRGPDGSSKPGTAAQRGSGVAALQSGFVSGCARSMPMVTTGSRSRTPRPAEYCSGSPNRSKALPASTNSATPKLRGRSRISSTAPVSWCLPPTLMPLTSRGPRSL